jgi:type I restriction enzyme, S subunit
LKVTWPVKQLGDVCEIMMGQSPDGDSYNTNGEGVPLINGPVEFSAMPFGSTIRAKFTTQPTKYCKQGDLILCVRGSTTGRMNIAGFDACIGRGVAAIRAKQYQRWINYFVLANRDEIHGRGTGATFPNVSGAILSDFKLGFPEISEQKRIVAILDEAFDGIATAKANAEKNLQNSRELFESYLQSIFANKGASWKTKPMAELADFRNGINYTKDSKGEFVKIVGVKDFQKSYSVPFENLSTVRLDGNLNELDVLKQGDILAVRSNGNVELIGRCILAGVVTERVSHSGFTIRIRLSSNDVLPDYLCHFLKSKSTRKKLTDGGTGTNIKSLNQGMLSSLSIPYPTVLEQELLIGKLKNLSEETQHLESLYQQKLAALDELKKSLLHQAFSGEL